MLLFLLGFVLGANFSFIIYACMLATKKDIKK